MTNQEEEGGMRILHVLSALDRAGPANVCSQLVRGLVRRGCAVEILSLREPDPGVAEALGVEVHHLDMRGPMDRGVARALEGHLRRSQPQIVHCHQVRADVYAAAAARRVGIPAIVSTIHAALLDDYGYTYGQPGGWGAYLWHRRSLRRQHDALVFVSDYARQQVQKHTLAPLCHPHTTVIHNGLEPELFAEALRLGPPPEIQRILDSGRPLLGCVGNLIRRKNVAAVIQAVGQLAQEGLFCDLVIVGSGPEERRLKRMTDDLGLQAQVHFLGYQRNVPAILAGLDIYIHPSLSEGCPLAVVEAMLMGRAIVASAAGGIPEIIEDGQTGLLSPPGQLGPLVQNLRRALVHEEYRRKLGAAAQSYALTHLTAQAMTESYLAAYRGLLGETSGNEDRPEAAPRIAPEETEPCR